MKTTRPPSEAMVVFCKPKTIVFSIFGGTPGNKMMMVSHAVPFAHVVKKNSVTGAGAAKNSGDPEQPRRRLHPLKAFPVR